MAPAWEQLASDWKDHAIGLVAEVDCTDPAGQSVCEDFEVQGFPTLVYGDPRSPEVRPVWITICYSLVLFWIRFF